MDSKNPTFTTQIHDTRSGESDQVGRSISTFLTARSAIFRELAEIREQVSEVLTRDPPYTALILHWKAGLIAFGRDGTTRKATSTFRSSGEMRTRRLTKRKKSFLT